MLSAAEAFAFFGPFPAVAMSSVVLPVGLWFIQSTTHINHPSVKQPKFYQNMSFFLVKGLIVSFAAGLMANIWLGSLTYNFLPLVYSSGFKFVGSVLFNSIFSFTSLLGIAGAGLVLASYVMKIMNNDDLDSFEMQNQKSFSRGGLLEQKSLNILDVKRLLAKAGVDTIAGFSVDAIDSLKVSSYATTTDERFKLYSGFFEIVKHITLDSEEENKIQQLLYSSLFVKNTTRDSNYEYDYIINPIIDEISKLTPDLKELKEIVSDKINLTGNPSQEQVDEEVDRRFEIVEKLLSSTTLEARLRKLFKVHTRDERNRVGKDDLKERDAKIKELLGDYQFLQQHDYLESRGDMQTISKARANSYKYSGMRYLGFGLLMWAAAPVFGVTGLVNFLACFSILGACFASQAITRYGMKFSSENLQAVFSSVATFVSGYFLVTNFGYRSFVLLTGGYLNVLSMMFLAGALVTVDKKNPVGFKGVIASRLLTLDTFLSRSRIYSIPRLFVVGGANLFQAFMGRLPFPSSLSATYDAIKTLVVDYAISFTGLLVYYAVAGNVVFSTIAGAAVLGSIPTFIYVQLKLIKGKGQPNFIGRDFYNKIIIACNIVMAAYMIIPSFYMGSIPFSLPLLIPFSPIIIDLILNLDRIGVRQNDALNKKIGVTWSLLSSLVCLFFSVGQFATPLLYANNSIITTLNIGFNIPFLFASTLVGFSVNDHFMKSLGPVNGFSNGLSGYLTSLTMLFSAVCLSVSTPLVASLGFLTTSSSTACALIAIGAAVVADVRYILIDVMTAENDGREESLSSFKGVSRDAASAARAASKSYTPYSDRPESDTSRVRPTTVCDPHYVIGAGTGAGARARADGKKLGATAGLSRQ